MRKPSPKAERPLSAALLTALAVFAFAFAFAAQRADAVIMPAVTIDGPSEDIVGFGGVAMAEDGTGGLVYLKRVDGVPHVFVARFAEGHFSAPIRVDPEQPFAASWPTIGAADGGQLVVIWATPFATQEERPVEELLSSTLGPGSQAFGPSVIVDPNIGEGTGTSPDLAMSPTGQADVVYRVVQKHSATPLLRAGDVIESVRLSHYGGERWSRPGSINRNPGVSMRPPTEANAPQVAIGPTGNGAVVWQEPEITGVARIWARRLFGSTVNYVLPVSATTFNKVGIGDDADAPTVAVSKLGEVAVAYRQSASAGSPLPGPRIFLNLLPDGESEKGAEFAGAKVADTSVTGGKSAKVGRPSIDIDEKQDLRLLYDSNGQPRVVEGTDLGLTGTLTLGSSFVGSELSAASELPSASVMNPEGGGVSAWPSADGSGNAAVSVREDFPEGGVQTGLVSGGNGGPIGELAVGRSQLGDGLVAFQQGPLGDAAIVASEVTAPPARFVVSAPKAWIKPGHARISWEPASSASGPITYSVILDGRPLPTPAGALSLKLNPRGLGTGSHKLQLLATDALGQATLSAASDLRIDGGAPTVQVRRAMAGAGVKVRVVDPDSGVVAKAVVVSFGDGSYAHGHAVSSHRYAHAGVYTVTVKVRDKLGNAGVVSRPVSVR